MLGSFLGNRKGLLGDYSEGKVTQKVQIVFVSFILTNLKIFYNIDHIK